MPLHGVAVPADHGFLLYAAISRLIPGFHANQLVGVHPVEGELVGGRLLKLSRTSRLVLRLPASQIPEALPLVGRTVDLGGSPVVVGPPTVLQLTPAPALHSRLVVIKGFTEPDEFLAAAQRQLDELEVRGSPSLVLRTPDRVVETGKVGGRGPLIRRTLRIRDKEIVGFALGVSQLTAEESLRLQEAGIGGRRRFGCGVFVPLAR